MPRKKFIAQAPIEPLDPLSDRTYTQTIDYLALPDRRRTDRKEDAMNDFIAAAAKFAGEMAGYEVINVRGERR